MNSKDWKLALFAVLSATLLTACPDKKKTPPPTPFTGIWVVQDNLKEYSSHRGELLADRRDGFCRNVMSTPDRYRDHQSVRAILVQSNGEVYRYKMGQQPNSVGFREMNYLGAVNPAGQFVGGSIGPRGEIVRSWNVSRTSIWDLPQQTTFYVKGNVLTIYDDSYIINLERVDNFIMQDYTRHVGGCIQHYRHWEQRGGVMMGPNGMPPQYGQQGQQQGPGGPPPLNKDQDPYWDEQNGGRPQPPPVPSR